MADFLFEIGLEEVPARMIAGAQLELEQRVVKMLERERLVRSGAATKSFATPRRLAVRVAGVAERQEDMAEELVGPSVKVAYKDGVATPAALAFAKKAGVDVAGLKTITNAKGEYLAATSVKAGRGAVEVIAAEMAKELAGIYWAKNMYWRAGRPERFVRPVRWMVAMLGAETVPVEFGGYVAGTVTYGHRVLFGDREIELKDPGDYEDALLGGFVIAEVEARRQKIRKALDRVTRAGDPTGSGLLWREDHELVDKLTQLTEWPSVLLGGFEKEYLALPEEVLVTVMRDHQNYFAVEDKDGRLAPHFLAVLNTEADDAGVAVIRHGNERVLRARFNDARFFWEFDQRVPLMDRVALLENVTFQKDLGSYFAKTERVRVLAARWADDAKRLGDAEIDAKVLDEAVTLAKTDLTTELVKEFTELQGEVGGLYARAQGFSVAVADAIYDQYRPTSMEDRIPHTAEGQLLAIADKADTISGMFELGLVPTGSKDPFALRRAANGIVKILAEGKVPLGLWLIARSSADFEAVGETIGAFFAERLEFYLREARGQSYDVVKAVLATGSDDVRDAVARAEAVTEVRSSEDFTAVASAFKRMKNILAQAKEKGIASGATVDRALLTEPTEKALAEKSAELADRVSALRAQKNYSAALEQIATLRPQVDAFFEAVMVMSPDEAVRANRLALLEKVLGDFSGIADFSEIVVSG
ncbi:glycine--tRNA ligase subunit beta [Tunturiibacter gelidoferens]|uniref:Glycine--tRNA ligase beta subunit n=1 Tax=Tunturiibacter gelidiferens TaxID=3069689 RepID=A0A9X0QIV3_9BACT|nr:glycine--tRNA ligase subunit beta [Edaphobacter lichenicola]MBB5331084.1 glycyl-tRNA synthetase beta chain [Edaphobacter lichenicola]